MQLFISHLYFFIVTKKHISKYSENNQNALQKPDLKFELGYSPLSTVAFNSRFYDFEEDELITFFIATENTRTVNWTSVFFKIPKILQKRYNDEKNIGFCSIKRAWQQSEKNCSPVYKQIHYLCI